MQQRLQNLLVSTAIIYSLWMALVLYLRHTPSLAVVAAQITLGILLGIIFVYINDTHEVQLQIQDIPLNLAAAGLLFGLFAAFGVRALVWEYIGSLALRGALFGLLMWGLGYVRAGIESTWSQGPFMAAGVCLGGLFSAPFLSEWLFDGAIFLIAAIGTRIAASLMLTRAPLERQGFIFGIAVGMVLVLVPFIGYFSYGTL